MQEKDADNDKIIVDFFNTNNKPFILFEDKASVIQVSASEAIMCLTERYKKEPESFDKEVESYVNKFERFGKRKSANQIDSSIFLSMATECPLFTSYYARSSYKYIAIKDIVNYMKSIESDDGIMGFTITMIQSKYDADIVNDGIKFNSMHSAFLDVAPFVCMEGGAFDAVIDDMKKWREEEFKKSVDIISANVIGKLSVASLDPAVEVKN